MPVVVINGPVIAAGQSLSAGLECNGRLVKITGPVGWDPADISFQSSTDGNSYNNVFDSTGKEIKMTMDGSNKGYHLVNPLYVGWLKIRSGTLRRPVPQSAEREFAVAVDTTGVAP